MVGGLGFRLDEEATYRITVAGKLDPGWWDTFEGLTVTVDRSQGGGRPVTCLVGEVADQAALHGVLHRLYALGLPLLAVECVTAPARGEGRA